MINAILPPTLIIAFLFIAAEASASVAWRRIDSSPHGVLPPPHADVEPTASLAVDVDNDAMSIS